MQTEVAEKLYSVKEYLAFEERAKNKHEYFNGKIVKMPGATQFNSGKRNDHISLFTL